MKLSTLCLIAAGTTLLASFTGSGQTSVVWKAHESAMATKDKQAGQFFDPQYSPVDPSWVSIETESEDSRMLYLVNDKKGKKIEISTSKKKAEDEALLSGGGGAMHSGFNGDLVWAPVAIDGDQWFAFVGSGTRGNLDVYLGRAGDTPSIYRVTSDSSLDESPQWSPDGTQLIFTSTRSGLVDLYILRDMPRVIAYLKQMKDPSTVVVESMEGGKWIERLTDDPSEELFPTFSPDGKYVAYSLLKTNTDGSLNYQLVAKDLTTGKITKLLSDKSRILRNPSFSNDGKYLACYSAGKKNDATVRLIVAQVTYLGYTISAVNTKWADKEVKRFEDVKSRLRGPFWTNAGSLLFLNEKNGDKHTIYELTSQTLSSESTPAIGKYVVMGEGKEDFNLRDFDFPRSIMTNDGVLFSAQYGKDFGVYTTMTNDILSSVPSVKSIKTPHVELSAGAAALNTTPAATTPQKESTPTTEQNALGRQKILGARIVMFRYMGDASQSTSSWGGEGFGRIMASDDIAINASIGFGSLEGSENDANGNTISFVSNLLYGFVSPAYRVVSSPSLALWLKAGVGLGYLDSQNEFTKGVKLLFNGSGEIDVPVGSDFLINGNVGITTSTGDLDGIRKSSKPDNFLMVSVGIAKIIE